MPTSDQGVDQARYTLVPRTLIFLTRGANVLLLHGTAHKRLWPNLYNGIGGHVEPGEDLQSSAEREINEETGLQTSGLRLYGTITVDTGQNPGVCIFVFKGEALPGDPKPTPEGALEWVPMGQVSRLPLVEDLYQWLPRLFTMTSNDPPFALHIRYDADGKIIVK